MQGVPVKPTAKAAKLLEGQLTKLNKRIAGYDALLQERVAIQRALVALRGGTLQPVAEEGMDGGGVNHVVRRRKVA